VLEQPDLPKDRMAEVVGRVVGEWVERELAGTSEKKRAERALALCHQVLGLLEVGADEADGPQPNLRLLKGVGDAGSEVIRPATLTPLSDTTLLTNGPNQPHVGSEISHELESADNVDVLMAFVRWTGIRYHLDGFRSVIERGGRVRLLTTTYTGSTEAKALDVLTDLGVEVKVSYNTQATRLHAKAWLFQRHSGFSTGLVGSSNLTHQAQVTGLEWNVRASSVTTPAVIERVVSTFETYWNDPEFEPYDAEVFASRMVSSANDVVDITHLDVRPYPFQQQILDELDVERHEFDRWHNLVVAATGTGKTVVAALDYRRLCEVLPSSRLLFVAHRKEILQQSRHTFRAVMRDGSFGEMWADGQTPTDWRHVFASVQTVSRSELTKLDPEQFDVVIVDEFHHAAAASYTALLDHLQPKVLLGLTATPERTDGLDITKWFGGRIAVELRLWDAIDKGLLSPFHYFGVHDDVDLSRVGWQRGSYVISDLENLYTGDSMRVAKVIQALTDVVADVGAMRALGFCVTVAHAEFMAHEFNKAGIPSVAVSGNTPVAERDKALRDLRAGDIAAVFSRDVFNEGVDIPEADTVLLLRPTESPTIYLQQLGRGLRKHHSKQVLTVLDFIGQHRAEYRLDLRFRKILKGSRSSVIRQVEDEFPYLPAGCQISLDRVSKEVVLTNLRNALPSRWKDMVAELTSFPADTALAQFLDGAGLDLADLYRTKKGWTTLQRAANRLDGDPGEHETSLQRAVGRLLHVDDTQRLRTWQSALRHPSPPDLSTESVETNRLLFMLHTVLFSGQQTTPMAEGHAQLWQHQPIIDELLQVLDVRADHLERMHDPLGINMGGEPVPVQVHARYSRDEILAAFGLGMPDKVPQLREGVKWIEEANTDLFFITLNKSEDDYSPTTRYRDYAISPELFHWESQSGTRVESPTGQRYVNQRENGTNVVLFVRERKAADGFTQPYVCLGMADYVSHEGERPIAITYRLRQPMPADFFLEARAAAG
jgi:superfamily II DNA or RNA helicase